ncbi:amidohydrolase family protein [Chloroflexota bacterium]
MTPERERWILGGKALRRLDGEWVLQDRDLRFDGNRIAEVAHPTSRHLRPGDIDARDRIIIPGMVNAHVHSMDNFRRGMFDNMPLELYGLRKVPVAGSAPMSASALRVRTLLGGIESLLTGSTSLIDDIWYENTIDSDSIHTVMGAYEELGIRAWVTANLGDLPVTDIDPLLKESLDPNQYRVLAEAFTFDPDQALSICEDALERYNGPRSDGLVRFVMGASGPQQCTEGFLQRIWEMARRWQVPVVSHLLETRAQAITGEIRYGMTLVEYLHRLGCLDKHSLLVHGIWLTPSDVDLLSTSGATVIHCPTSNLRLGSGVCPVPALLNSGVNVALGTDSTSTSDTQNLFLELRLAGCLHAAEGPDYSNWVQPDDAFAMATLGGAAAVGQEGTLGEIEPGFKADLVLLDENSTAFAPLNDPVKNIVFAEYGQSVRAVIVDGRVVVEDGCLVTLDQQEIWREAREHARHYFACNESGFRSSDSLLPAFKEAYWRAQGHSWSPSRYIYG